MMNNLDQCILESIASGKKGVDLATDLASNGFTDYDENQYTIDNLIWAGKIIEIEYEIPTMGYRTKSFYLPGNSIIKIRQEPT